jgi:hypothetical protein
MDLISSGCPPWCVTAHDPARGEDDWLHVSEPLPLPDGASARLCMSIDVSTGERDGPFVLVGDHQLTPDEARRLGLDLEMLATRALEPLAAHDTPGLPAV